MLTTRLFTVRNNKKNSIITTLLTNWHFESLYLLTDFEWKKFEVQKIQMNFLATEKTMMNL